MFKTFSDLYQYKFSLTKQSDLTITKHWEHILCVCVHSFQCVFPFWVRELLEESGLTVDTLEKVGNIQFEMVSDAQLLDVHIFRADSYNGEPTETEGRVSTVF